jgi:transposase, IS30 family
LAHDVEVRDRLLDLVCAGASLSQAAAAVGVSKASASRWWSKAGPVTLKIEIGRGGGLGGSPPPDLTGTGRARRPLTSEDRAVIAAGLRQGLSRRQLAALIGRNASVVCREVTRNSGPGGSYHPGAAHRAAAQARRRPKPFKLAESPGLCRRIEAWMDQGWSPQLIAAVLAADPACPETERVSHETIYRALYVQSRGQLRADLHRQLSLGRAARKPRGRTRRENSPYREAFTISQRPAEAANRAVPGHWEGDLIVGPGSRSAIGTLVERSTRFTILLHLPDGHDADAVAAAMIREMRQLPQHLRRSITWDRGTELAQYAHIQLALDTRLFFCAPRSPWQRGTNENTNRLLRHWFAKGSDLSVHTPDDLRRIAATLNARPRPTLDLQTPAARLNTLLTAA